MMNATMNIEGLRKQYCPPLDDSLFYSILNDYNSDLDDPSNCKAFIETLDSVRSTALQQEQENSDFDPSGTSGLPAHQQENHTWTPSVSSPDEDLESNGVTSITTALTNSKWDGSSESGTHPDDLSAEKKEEELQQTFSKIAPYEIKQALKVNDGDLNRTVDYLLNLSALDTINTGNGKASLIPRGIEGFAGSTSPKKRKGRAKMRARNNESSRATSEASFMSDTSIGQSSNVWSAAKDDVEFIAARTTLAPEAIRSVYHAVDGARLPATIRHLAIRESMNFTSLEALGENLQFQINDIKVEFPTLPDNQAYGLLMITRNMPSAAHELVQVMLKTPEPAQLGKVEGLVKYAPYTPEPETSNHATSSKAFPTPFNYSRDSSPAANHTLEATENFQKASMYHQRSKSNHLLGGAAAYYAALAHENLKVAKAANSIETNDLVDRQSTPTSVDLHGVTVADAVRIAKIRTEAWWEGLGDEKFKSGGGGPARAGYRIITGAGNHSKDGAQKIRPAVSAMLMREGWKFYDNTGEVVVYGRKR